MANLQQFLRNLNTIGEARDPVRNLWRNVLIVALEDALGKNTLINYPYDKYNINYGDPIKGDGMTYWWRDESDFPTNTPFDININRRDIK